LETHRFALRHTCFGHLAGPWFDGKLRVQYPQSGTFFGSSSLAYGWRSLTSFSDFSYASPLLEFR
jgi:hypothetical protein